MQLVHSTSIMIRMLMCLETTHKDINQIEAVICMFLIHYDNIDMGIKDTDIPS
jgi:hypothetical protein